ncbi:MAG: carboxypeptidase-like regulatory domain-containing protein [Acidobacteria bacterium]|nr:carboxypeptidase-like regulatory domain-containing protein [Acidobacteriota bacterium]MCL5286485.1 carboxypeptidase-like regulatory domain-containing protein [Acidobacteriota bacterium]
MNCRRIPALAWAFLLGLALAAPVCADTPYGKLTGVVVDPAGVPQMGATVVLLSEEARVAVPIQFQTNDRGIFSSAKVRPGYYSVRVTLAGFLPALERHIHIEAKLTTMLRVELDSVFTSLDRLRRQSVQPSEADDWAWVLRASTATRPVLRFANDEAADDDALARADAPSYKRGARGRVELTSGARRPGSVSNIVDAPSTAFAYEQKVGRTQRLIFAGDASYERSSSAGLATIWLPSGELGNGPQTTLVLRRTQLSEKGPVFRGARMDHSGVLTLGDRIVFRYGAEYLLVGVGRSTSSLRPRGQLEMQLAHGWQASLTVAPRPFSALGDPGGALQSALLALDAFPAVFLRNGRPVLESGWHDEIAIEHELGRKARVVASVFRDRSRHTAVFGRGSALGPDFFQDSFSHSFAYDGGESNAMGTRLAYHQKFSGDWEADVIYAWAGALAPEWLPEATELRKSLATRQRHSFAARVAGRVPYAGTYFSASYKWISGAVASRQDAFGETLYLLDPNLNVRLRQPLPSFFLPGKVEALADFRNLLAQGYVPVNTPEGQILLVPSFRTFRGGFSFQF